MRLLPCFFLLLSLAACQPKTRFVRLSASQTGIDFANTITETDSMNVLEFEYIYNGGGVGVGDFNGDGFQDVFFAGNQVSGKLYLNKGKASNGAFSFADITKQAGVETRDWCTGVAVEDINQDGRLDIYVSTIHPDRTKSVPNLLFMNMGNDAAGVPHFREMARAVGLADSSYSTQAAFLDYDRDGDLDLFLLTNALEAYNRNNVTGPRNNGLAKSRDKLYRNDSPPPPKGVVIASETPPLGGGGLFTDVSGAAGITHEGWGLGVVVNDINQDGWPDVYVANDFQSNDVLYLNNQHGGFMNGIADALKHQSHNSMGVDMADINNDGLNDLAVVDMLPDDNLRQKTMFGSIPHDRFQMARRMGYQPQYARNMLQLNRGGARFSDIGYLAGVAATDWSWSALFADLDNDGFRDLLITNGYRKDITDLDFTSYNRDDGTFGSDESRRKRLLKRVEALKPVYKPNVLFHSNGGNLTFTNVAAEWGLPEPSFTNGTAYADFDNDGDLDLVMNNINDPAFVYQNRTVEMATEAAKNRPVTGKKVSTSGQFLRLKLIGKPGNRQGLGAKVLLYAGQQRQYAEQTLQRGYLATVEPIMHFGLGTSQQLDSLRIWWPDGTGQTLRKISANQVLALKQTQARPVSADFALAKPAERPSLAEVSHETGLLYRHDEDDFVDYKQQQTLLPHKLSQQGPQLTTGDVNGDGLDDLYIGGSANRAGTLFIQQKTGTFRRENLLLKPQEEMGVLLFDADGDHDLDLYAVAGSTEFGRIDKNPAAYRHRLLLNDGRGHFTEAMNALPNLESSGSCVTAADFDGDGDLDLFVGGRCVPQRYPEPGRSYLLRNNSLGRKNTAMFTDVTDQIAPDLSRVGMVCAALWTDYDNDHRPDLLVTGEFMAPTFFRNQQGKKLNNVAMPQLSDIVTQKGWWNCLAAGDFDHDGDVDYVAGNAGLNTRHRASPGQPVRVYAKDYDQNGTLDALITAYNYGNEYLVHPRETLTDQWPAVKKKFPSYADYGSKLFADLISAEQRAGALTLEATNFASVYIENRGKGQFAVRPLPVEAQFSPMFGMLATDVDHDGNLDVLLVGNDYANEVLSGQYDAGYGLWLRGNGRGKFTAISPGRSGFVVPGDGKALVQLRQANGQMLYLASQNQDSLRVFRQPKSH